MNRTLRDLIGCVGLAALVGCTPALNWREIRLGDSGLQALMPCRPDAATRTVQLPVGSQVFEASLRMQGCEASEMQFTLTEMTLPEELAEADAQATWRAASLAALKIQASDVPVQAWRIEGAQALPAAQRAEVATPTHRAQWVWFVHAHRVYQAAVYGDAKASKLNEAAEVYFSGIKLP